MPCRAAVGDSPVFVGVGVDQYRLRVGFRDQVLEVGEQRGLSEPVSCRCLGEQLAVRLGDADNLDLGAVPRLIEESVHMSMHQAHNADSKRRLGGQCLR